MICYPLQSTQLFLLETFQMYLTMSLLFEKNLQMLPKTNIVLPFNGQYFRDAISAVEENPYIPIDLKCLAWLV